MDEKMKPKESENLNTNEKLTWEAPKLYYLDKSKTKGSTIYDPIEDGGSYGPS